MTIAPERQDAEFNSALDYVPAVRGYAVLINGPGADGGETLALWTLSALGTATGAWVLPLTGLDESHLIAVMTMARGRCLVGWTKETATEALDKAEATLPAALVTRLRIASLAIPDLIAETREHRVLYSNALTANGSQATAKIASLKWKRELPSEGQEASALSRQPVSVSSPTVSAALAMAGALRQAIGYWQETEEARYRRPQLRALGEPQPLPPRWRACLQAAESGMEV
jgi:hypothetical protein